MKLFEEEFGVNPNKTIYQSLARGCRKKSDGMWLLKEMEVWNRNVCTMVDTV